MEKDLLDLSKALDTSPTNGNNVLDPVLLSRIISEQARRLPALRNVIKRQPWNTNLYTWNTEITPGDAQTAADGATIAFADGNYAQSSVKMSYLYHVCMITNPAIQAAQELVDLVSVRVGGGTKQVLRQENKVLFNGDPNNANNPGLVAALNSNSPNVSSGSTVNRSFLAGLDVALRGEGYEADAFVVSPAVYNLLSQAAYNNVRFMGVDGQANVGYALFNKNINFNGIPVIMDKYAESVTAITSQNMVAVGASTTQFNFTTNGTNIARNVYKTAGGDLAGSTWAAPVIKVSGATVSNYSFTQDTNGNVTVTFTGAPAATPVATFTYGQDNVFALSLDPADLVIAEQMPICVEQDLAKPVQQDAIPLRVKMYSALAVRNAKAHAMATNVSIPTLANF